MTLASSVCLCENRMGLSVATALKRYCNGLFFSADKSLLVVITPSLLDRANGVLPGFSDASLMEYVTRPFVPRSRSLA